ncbi:hypothetical protein BB560_001882 [Smittium megazygosporum]|uniref:D-arabinono-1,4-lactone oxidase n=1 Tax=Smittium megazygosporum TaxID=133381 RepID=A0A2T9ZGB0_9FUNG|nr:hypothetical protein BB560_001882 [Smittium megazygosporum]
MSFDISPLSESENLKLLELSANAPGKPVSVSNWSKTFSCTPKLLLAPRTENDVIWIINFARNRNLKVKPVGSKLSPSDISCTDGIMISMENFNRVLQVDKRNCTITVESGVPLSELHKILEFWGLALSSIGSISLQTICGAISTATHGTGVNYGCFSSIVLDLVLIDGMGIRHYCSENENKDLFDAARCSLGALGIITQVTIQCEPSFRLKAVQIPKNLDEILDNLHETVTSAEHVRFWWFPYTNDTVLWRANRTTDPKEPLKESFVVDKLYGFHYYQFQLLLSRMSPDRIPTITKEHYNARFNKKIEWVDDSYNVFNMDCLFPQYVDEWAIPIQNTANALRFLRKWINEQQKIKDGVRVHFPVEVRFVKADDVWLSPCYQQTVCYIGVIMYRPYRLPVPYKKYWRAYEDIMRTFGGRPHWAKAHKMYYFEFEKQIPRFNDFQAIREICDPSGLFVNDYVKRHILPPSQDDSSDSMPVEQISFKMSKI